MKRLIAGWVLLLPLSGCPAQPPSGEPTLDIHDGDPCRVEAATCIDDEAMLRCIDGSWTEQGCAEYCAGLGTDVGSLGCDIELQVATPAQLCTCTPGPDGCRPGQGLCEDQNTLQWCADDWSWVSSACDDVCAATSQLALGCASMGDAAVCMCTLIGTPCAGESPLCSSDDSVAVCVDGTWTEQSCKDVCGAQAPCDPAASNGAACDCAG